MKSFFERLQIRFKNEKDRVVLCSQSYPQGVTYKQLDEQSNRVCKYLKDKNIGKESFVMVLMPREASAYIAIIGAWKSGAAVTILEEDYSPERVNYIKKELNCKLVITSDIFEEMMKYEPCDSYEIPSAHDACYVAYTSGSTGNPKGILHEFGKLDTFDYDYNGELEPDEGDNRFAIVTSLNFGPSIRNAVTSLLYGKCLYIVPKNTVRNRKQLLKYFNDNKISETSVTCSFFKACAFDSNYLKNVFVHSEPCTDVFSDKINVINLYTLSEVVFPIFTFKIDKAYYNAPLGNANGNVDIKIVNEAGIKTKPYEIGEIIVEDIFTRGYINLAEENKSAFADGYFYTGDLAYYDENEKVYLSGRKDEMIKINGNRIEPMEIEKNIKNILNVKNVIAKGFTDDNRSFTAAWFLRDELKKRDLLNSEGNLKFTVAEIQNRLREYIPDYMIPTYYTVIDNFPKNENGKISRKALLKPSARDYQKINELPENAKEKYFCELFEKVLGLDVVGVNDDFYEIGGDSISAIMMISECERFELSISEIYKARTPRALSKIIPEKDKKNDFKNQNAQAILTAQPLLTEQRMTFEGQMAFPDYTLNNIIRFFKLNKNTDINKFKDAVNKVMRHHPVFSSVLINDNGIEKLCYKPEKFREIETITIKPTQLQMITENFRKPFIMENQLLYRHSIYQCVDEAYFYLEIHHIITDGTSLKNLFNEIDKCYCDKNAELIPDYCYLFLQNKAVKAKTDENTLSKIAELYQINEFNNGEDNTIKYDNPFTELVPAMYKSVLHIDKSKIINNGNYKKYKGNVFFLTCFLKTMAEYNNREKAFTFWEYNGREQKEEQNIHSMIIKTFPMGIDFKLFTDIEKAFENVKGQISKQISSEIDFIDLVTDDFMFTPYFIYQRDILYCARQNSVFDEEFEIKGGCQAFEFHLIDNSNVDSFEYIIKYTHGSYCVKSIKRFCELFEKTVNLIIGNN